jgi:hypothetical protein
MHLPAQGSLDSTSVYFKAKQFLKNGNYALYKYGNIKPRDIEDAFCVFLTGNDQKLEYFRTLDLNTATEYALKAEHNLMRYDWGCESFRDFSKYMILKYELWAPKLQYAMAVQCFHAWINLRSPDFVSLSKTLRSSNKVLNQKWKTRYLEFTKYANNEHLKGKSKRKHQRFLKKSRACSL